MQFQAYLKTVEPWHTIEDPLPPNPENQQEYERWKKVDWRALCKLDSCAKAKKAWDRLKSAFHASTMAREVQLGGDVAALRKASEETIVVYAERAKETRVELAGVSDEQMIDRRAIIHLLAGIVAPEYEATLTVVANYQYPLSWEAVVERLLVAEASIKKKKALKGTTTQPPGLGVTGVYGATVEGKSRQAVERRRRTMCWNCGERGHYSNEWNRIGLGPGGAEGPPGKNGQSSGGAPVGSGSIGGFLATAAFGRPCYPERHGASRNLTIHSSRSTPLGRVRALRA